MAAIPIRLRGWRFILLNGVTGLANVVVLSNVPGYTILAPYAAGNFQGVTPSFGTWATSDHMVGLALGKAALRARARVSPNMATITDPKPLKAMALMERSRP